MYRKLVMVLGILTALTLHLGGCTKKSEKAENTIQTALNINLKGLDPIQASDQPSTEVQSNIYETLYQYHYLKRPLELESLLAQGQPKISADGLTYTFTIKQGVKFQDSEVFPDGKGREVMADDFIYSWKRLADPRLKSDGFWIFDGKIKGLNEWRDKLNKGEGNFEDAVTGLTAVDPQTLKVQLNVPYHQLLYVLTMTYSAVVPKEAVQKYGEEFLNHPVGTGPYRLTNWVRGSKIELVKNPNWHGGQYPSEGEAGDAEKGLLEDKGKALPFIDKVVFQEIIEDQPRWLNFIKGTLDFSTVPKDNFDSTIANNELTPEMKSKGIELLKYPRAEVVYMGFNMEDPILGKNRNLRQALCYAYDTKISMEKFYNNMALMAHSPIGPDMDGWDADYKTPCKETSIEKAKEFLAKAGYPGGKGLPSIEYSVTSSTTSRQMAEYLAQQLEQIGVKVNIVANSWPQFTDRLRNKKSQMYGIAWIADYPDSENMFQLLYGKNKSPGPNNSNFDNAEFNKLYEAALKLPPGAKRTALYKKMRDIFSQELPWIPTVHRIGVTVKHGWVNNLKRNETINGYYKYLRLDLNKKAELKAKL